MFDVFISHKSDCKPWVRVLAQNLKNQGYKVFLDEWELIPGKNLVEDLFNGLKQSRKGILVVTSGAFESGWVREEYSLMMTQKQEKKDFSIIPVVLEKEVLSFSKKYLLGGFQRQPAIPSGLLPPGMRP
jgi:hypothetical protein